MSEFKYSPSRWTGQAVRWSDLTPVGGTRGCLTEDRLDPFWGGMWTQGAAAMWVSREVAKARVDAGLARMPAHLMMPYREAVEHLAKPRSMGARMAALGAVDQWRTVSGEQLVALSGWSHLGSGTSSDLVSLFAAGLIDHGSFASVLLPGASFRDRGMLYRPSRSTAFEEVLSPMLSYAQRVAITGGTPWDFRRQYDRHNLLSTELGLRVAERCEVGTVVGEKLSTIDMYTGTGAGGEPSKDERAADMTIVRRDGMRIAVELTASVGPDFTRKVRRWAQLLASQPMDASGLMVLFVEAAPPTASSRHGKYGRVLPAVYKAVARVVREFPGVGRDRVADRMGVVSWAQWFPAAGFATREFTRLEVDQPSGPVTDTWNRVSLLDEIDVPFTPADPARMRAVIDGVGMLAGTPHWLRTADPAPIWPILTREAGWGEGLPVRPPARENRFSGVYRPEVLGVVGHTREPEMMRTDCIAAPPGAVWSPPPVLAPSPLPGW